MIDSIKAQLKDAMINKDKIRITALRNFIAKLKAKEIDKKESLNDAESIKVLQSLSCFVDEKSLDYESLRNIKFLSDDSTLNKLDLLFPKIDKNLG